MPVSARVGNALGRTTEVQSAESWENDREMYQKRNEVERFFRRLKGFRRIFSRFDKLDVIFMFFILFALITDAIISVNTSQDRPIGAAQ